MHAHDQEDESCDTAALHEVLETFARAAGLAHVELRRVSGPLTASVSIAEHGTIPEHGAGRTGEQAARRGTFVSSKDRFVLNWYLVAEAHRVDMKLAMKAGASIRAILTPPRP